MHARRASFDIQVVTPKAARDDKIFIRVESLIQLDLAICPIPPGAPFLWDSIKIPKTESVKDTAAITLQRYLNFSLELRGATSNEACRSVCRVCGRRKSQRGTDIVDFNSRTDLVEIVDGRARICFHLKCYARHHQRGDDEFMYVHVRSRPWYLPNSFQCRRCAT
jgi:hypothetical protein